MKGTIIYLIFFIIFINACSKNPETSKNIVNETYEKAPVEFILERQIESKMNLFDIYIHRDKVYLSGADLTNKHDTLLKIYDKQFKYITSKSFRSGQGPGELGGNPKFFIKDDFVYCSDSTRAKINIYNSDFKFVDLVKSAPVSMHSCFSDDGRYFISTKTTFKRDKHIVNFYIYTFPDLKRKKFHTIGPFTVYKNKRIIFGGTNPYNFYCKNNSIFLLNKKNYTISVFDFKGKLTNQVSVNFKKIKTAVEMKYIWLKEQRESIRSFNRLKDRLVFPEYIYPASKIIPLGKGFVVIRRRNYSAKCEGTTEGDYFNNSLKLIGKVCFPCFRRILTIWNPPIEACCYKDGFLYLICEKGDDYIVQKWRVNESALHLLKVQTST